MNSLINQEEKNLDNIVQNNAEVQTSTEWNLFTNLLWKNQQAKNNFKNIMNSLIN